MKTITLFILTIATTISDFAQFNGSYIVGPSSPKIKTIQKAIDSLKSVGISGPTTFNIESGIYNSQYVLPEITGASATNTITFQSQTGDSTSVVITSDSADFTFKLDGADHIIFRNLTFTSDTFPTNVVEIRNRASNNLFQGNQFIGTSDTTNLLVSPQDANSIDTSNSIIGNYFAGGAAAIFLLSDGSTYEINNKILHNTFNNQNIVSVDVSLQELLNISGNIIRNNSAKALTISTIKRCNISANKIISGNIYVCPVQFSGNTDTTIIANNFISADNTNNGAVLLSGSYYIFTHNTVVSSGSSGIHATLSWMGNDKLIYNNIIVNKGYGCAVYSFSSVNNKLDYNCLYSTENNPLADWGGTVCSNLSAWQTTSGQDAHSLSVLPSFVSGTNPHTNSLLLDGAGIPVNKVKFDIDGEPRDDVKPDIGADEYTSTCSGSLSGEYIIGTSGHFITINEVVKALNDCGVSGSVVFKIQNGTYNEQILLKGTIPGYTKNDKITFQSESGDSTKVIITYKADTLHNYTVKLDGADGIVFKQISIHAEDTTYGKVIELGSSACNNMVQNCIIKGVVSKDNKNSKSLVNFISDNFNHDSGNVFNENVFINGSFGIYLIGNHNNKTTINKLSSNYFVNQSSFGIYARFQKKLIIEKNILFNKLNSVNYFYGISIDQEMDSTIITKNRIYINRDKSSIGLSGAGKNNLIANNFISIRSKSYNSKGISGIGTNSKCYNNTISMLGSGGSTAMDVTYSTNNADIKNNLLSNMAGGYAIYCLYDGTQILSSNNNDLYSTGDNTAYWLGTNITGLSEWKTATGFDNNSVSTPAHFVSDTDLHTTFTLLNKAGTSLPEVTEDIDGEIRDLTPDIGADEFFSISFSLGDDVGVCIDKSFRIDAGIGFDSYAWSTGETSASITVDSTGIGYGSKKYGVLVKKGTDQFVDSIKVSFSSPIAAPITNYCFLTGSADTISAGIGKTYTWSSGDSTQKIVHVHPSIWNYNVTVIDEKGCSSTGTIHIRTNPMKANMQMPEDTSICANSSIILHAIPSGWSCDSCSYLWSTGDTTQLITVDSVSAPALLFNYSVNVKYGIAGICLSDDSTEISLIKCPEIGNLDNHSEITVYPNPTTGIININAENILEVKISNLLGAIIMIKKAENLNEINLSNYQKGLYFMEILTENGFLIQKVILE